MLIGIVIIYWMIFKNPILPDFFTNYNLSVSLKTMHEPTTLQNFFIGDFAALILLVGVFTSYCYFYDHIRNIGWKINKFSSETSRLSSPFMYLFLLCVFIAVVFIGGAVEGYFNPLNSNKILEIASLSVVLIIAVLNVQVFRKIYQSEFVTHSNFTSVTNFLKKEKFDVIFNSFSRFIFIITLEVAVFGYIFGFNPLSIISLDIFLIFILWVLGILNQHPTHLSTILLTTGRSIHCVYILETDNNFIHYLTREDKIEKITVSSVLQVETNNESSISKSFQTGEEYQSAKNRICDCLSKISDGTIFSASIISIFIGILFYLIGAFLSNIMQNKISIVLGFFVILFLVLFVLVFLFLIIYITYKEISSNHQGICEPINE
jgi:hypothetical protein